MRHRSGALALALASAAVAGLVAQAPLRPSLGVTHRARALRSGEVVLLIVKAPGAAAGVRATVFERDVFFYRGPKPGVWHGLAGIDAEAAPGPHVVAVEAIDAAGAIVAAARHTLVVSRRAFPARRVTVDESFVTPPAEARARIDREAREVAEILGRVTRERLWEGAFAQPVPGAATSSFGRRSIVNGQARGIHGGVDLRAGHGTPVRAPARGQVALASDQYFAGNHVILDHGLGVFSLLAHLSRIDVVAGQMVDRGELVGLSGATGRVTGPHLHWSVRVQGGRVDPFSLVAALQEPAEPAPPVRR